MEASALLARIRWTKENEAIRFFQPNGGQQKFIDLVAKDGAFIVVNGSGNGGGKTYLIAAILAALMWPDIAPPCFSAPIFKNWPHPKRARIVSTPKELEEIGALQVAIQELFPKGRYEALKKGKSFPSQFVTDTGWILDTFSYEQDKTEMAGPTLGLIVWNEPMPQNLWPEGLARLRKGGLSLVAMTSLTDNPWVVDGILGRADGHSVRVMYSDVEENCREHGVNGTLDHAQIEKILAQYDPDEREARKTGKPLSLSGRIYKTFDRSVHVKEFDVPNAGVSHGMTVDPAIGKPLAIAWRFVDQSGIVHYYDEYPDFEFQGAKDSNLDVAAYVAIIKAKEEGKTMDTRILDRHFGNQRRTLGGKTLKQEFDEAGLEFSDSYAMEPAAEVEAGILKVKSYLKYDASKPIDSLNTPKVVIHPRCKNLIAAFERWSRNPNTLKPAEQYKDFMDVVRYDLMTEPSVEIARNWHRDSSPAYGVNNS